MIPTRSRKIHHRLHRDCALLRAWSPAPLANPSQRAAGGKAHGARSRHGLKAMPARTRHLAGADGPAEDISL